MHSMLHVDEPGLKERSASAMTVVTAAAMEGNLPIKTSVFERLPRGVLRCWIYLTVKTNR